MSLQSYRKMRDFSATSEPKGRVARKKGNSFVIQKHDARRLHYDFRLEMEGVLKSWAVTRGPSLNPEDKRLAVHVEDHPLEYGTFEGTIPKGEYGAGTVILWDRGTWTPIGDPVKGYAKGHLEFELSGQKLRGRWHLVRMQTREKRENWLLIKADDQYARKKGDILKEEPASVSTGRDLPEVEDEPPGWSSKDGPLAQGKKAAMPEFIKPMLAQLQSKPPSGDKWVHEIKFDGYRLQAHVIGGKAALLTRSGHDWTAKFGDMARKFAELALKSAIIDGELVVESDAGASGFSALQADLADGRDDRFIFYAFDLMYLDGHDLRDEPLTARKASLERILRTSDIRYSSHFTETGEMVLRHACRMSLEGIVSKLADAPYRSGRGRAWVKSKCSARQEFVVGGYVPSQAQADAIGSLVLGVHDADEDGLRHVGRVGTGFTRKGAADLFRRLQPLRRKTSPFGEKLAPEVVYTTPELVAEVDFSAWTADGHLRHAAFRGLREDKPAIEVTREDPPKARIKLTHPERIYWPDEQVTKEELANYYTRVWPQIASFIVNRPLALLRCPDGIDGPRFFQKHPWKGINSSIDQPKDKGEALIAISGLDGLIALVQSAALEIHPWGATFEDLERPDMIIMDLDPGEGASWDQIVAAATEVRQRLTDAGLTAFVKTSGGKGLHVVSPLKPHAKWPEVKAFTKAMAMAMESDAPDLYVATITKSKRKGKVLIDYLRNQRGATAVAAYSTRARPGAAVSTPVEWEALSQIGPASYTVRSDLPEPWDGFRKAARPLTFRPSSRRKATS
ncbi:DNA ligase D [Paracoccus sulfuroxidans]|uniref:DNA ligase (ATP) n=1 Tax=Paracoccus sulfuroxidans TaxID=384678 RepID=A0A562N8P9_9RHOB|nr:DNA ligase D [Paracoccus sulfuroxidans]TWI28251.1 bifunctional non-homologous end joining protein LigD [Paracoccus sulfuroxidans]